jgi:hypothetical protein
MRPHGASEAQSAEGERTQVIAGFVFDLAVSLDLGFDPADHGQVREHGFARVMPVRGHPVDLVADRVPTGFEPPSGEVRRLMGFEHHIVWRIVEQLLDIGIHGGPVPLQ